MKNLSRNLIVTALLALMPMGSSAVAGDIEIKNPQRAWTNWVLNCQGCHQPDAAGSEGGAPRMSGVVAKFLHVEGGREFLVRVPGVANAPLDEEQLADLVNWMLVTYDAENLPEDFEPYTAEEVAGLRYRPYIEDAEIMRGTLIRRINEANAE